MTTPRKNAPSTYTDPETGKFKPGNPGRPRGSRHKSSLAVESLLNGQSEALGQRAIQLALSGDTTALRLCLERILPPRKDAPVEFDFPDATGAKDAAAAAQAVVEAMAAGNLTPTEASAAMRVLESFGRVLQIAEFEGRLSAIERAVSGAPK